MLKNRRVATVFGLLAISILCLEGAASQPPSPQAPEVQTKQEPAEGIAKQSDATATPPAKEGAHPKAASSNAAQHAPEVTVFGIRVGEGVLAIATLLLVLATWKLVVDARKNAQRQLRAYISVKPRVARDVYAEGTARVDFLIINTGQTPAHNVRYLAVAEILPHPLVAGQPDLVIPIEGEPSARPVHPRMHIIGEAVSEEPISHEMFQAMIGDDHRFYLAGAVFYEDVFGIERKTKFCAYFGGAEYEEVAALAADRREQPVYNAWIFSHVHNEAT